VARAACLGAVATLAVFSDAGGSSLSDQIKVLFKRAVAADTGMVGPAC